MHPDNCAQKFIVQTDTISACGISDPGQVRAQNEDAIFLDDDGNFLLLADGMGGHERGAEASKTAIEIVQEFLQPESVNDKLMDITSVEGVPTVIVCLFALVDEAITEANSMLYTRNKEEDLQKFMGTTITGLVPLQSKYILWFHVGDSRIYRWRNTELEQLTTDHSVYAEWERDGRTGTQPAKNVITRAIGPSPAVGGEINWEPWQEGDVYLLCSDGLSDMISTAEITEILRREGPVEEIAEQLVDAANQAGGKDNTSVVVCRL